MADEIEGVRSAAWHALCAALTRYGYVEPDDLPGLPLADAFVEAFAERGYALTESGRLLPPGGEVSTEWRVHHVGGFWREGCPDEAAARDLFQRACDINRGNGSTYEMRRRQVVTTPDGFKAKWPWEVIERSPVVSDNSEVSDG